MRVTCGRVTCELVMAGDGMGFVMSFCDGTIP